MAHAHDFQPAGHVERCADEDCLAWQPLGRGDREPEPISQPRRLSPRERQARRDAVVVSLADRRRGAERDS